MFSSSTGDEANYLEMDARWRALRLMLSEYQDQKAGTVAINQLLHYSFQLIYQKQESLSIHFIHKNYYRNISLEELASLEHYHVSYYSQWFKKKMGVISLTGSSSSAGYLASTYALALIFAQIPIGMLADVLVPNILF